MSLLSQQKSPKPKDEYQISWADLRRKTSEQLDSWSLSLDSPLDSTKVFEIEPDDQAPIHAFHEGDMVSSPVSCLQDKAVPNMASVSKTPAAGQVSTSSKHETITSADTFALSNKPSFQSFLRRVAKVPSQEILVRDFAYVGHALNTTSPLGAIGTPSPFGHNTADTTTNETAQTTQRTTPGDNLKFGKSTASPAQLLAFRNVNTSKPLPPIPSTVRRSLPRSASSPLLRPKSGFRSPPSAKRKPLPKDSPLLIPLSEHPAFINILPAKALKKTEAHVGASEKTTEIDDQKDGLAEVEVLLSLPASPSSRFCATESTRVLR